MLSDLQKFMAQVKPILKFFWSLLKDLFHEKVPCYLGGMIITEEIWQSWPSCTWWEESYSAKPCQCPDSIKHHQEKGYSVCALLIFLLSGCHWGLAQNPHWLWSRAFFWARDAPVCMITQEMEASWRLKPKADGQAHQCTRHCPWPTRICERQWFKGYVYRPRVIRLAVCVSLPQIQGLSEDKWEFGIKVTWVILKGRLKYDSAKINRTFTHPNVIPKRVGDNLCGEGELTHPGVSYLNNNYDIFLSSSVASLCMELGTYHIHLLLTGWNSLV